MKKIADIVFNVFYFKIVLMILLIPTLLVYCVSYNYVLLSVMLYWGAAACLYDLAVRRTFVKARGMMWLLGFLAVFFLTVWLNYKTGFSYNFTSWAYTAIALFLLYPDGAAKDKDTALKELSVINNIFITMTTVMSTVSLGMFVCLYRERFIFGDQEYAVGWVHNRLFGIYANPGYMITAIGLALIVIQIALVKCRKGRVGKWYAAFLTYTAIVNFLCMCMENAKGAFISIAAFVAVAVFFIVVRKLLKKQLGTLRSYGASLLCAILSVALLFGAINVVRPLMSYLPSVYQHLGGQLYTESESSAPQEEEISEELESITIDREIDESYGFFTGRTVIWKFGVEEFLEKPIFGHGPQSHRHVFIVDNYLRHFHNLIVQTMVSVGTVGSVCIFTFLITVLFFLLKKLFAALRDSSARTFPIAALLMAFFGMLLVNSMAEVTVLFITRFAMFMFWIYLGYACALVNGGEQTKGMRLLGDMSNKVDRIFVKKRKNEK